VVLYIKLPLSAWVLMMCIELGNTAATASRTHPAELPQHQHEGKHDVLLMRLVLLLLQQQLL
jgi:hypothetical protein